MTILSKRSEAGFAHLAIVFLVVIIILGAGITVFAKIKSADDASKKDLSQSASLSSSDGSSLQINQPNIARKNDVSKLLGAVTEYANNNNGQLPTIYENGQVSGGSGTYPVPVSFEMYTAVEFASGHQESVTTTNELRLVAQAACGENGGAISGTSRGYVAQFVLEKVDGGHTSDCKEG